ncbi:MAG: LrgB family protein [Ruminococcaceae bacterium]|nr:LrgB family protein [Oscillospiraceae bacterium]
MASKPQKWSAPTPLIQTVDKGDLFHHGCAISESIPYCTKPFPDGGVYHCHQLMESLPCFFGYVLGQLISQLCVKIHSLKISHSDGDRRILASICLAILMYEQFRVLQKNLAAIGVGVTGGAVSSLSPVIAGLLTAILFQLILLLSRSHLYSRWFSFCRTLCAGFRNVSG